MTPFNHESRRKAGLFLLAAICAMLAGAGLHGLMQGGTPSDVVRGGGRLLLWGSIAALMLARVHGRSIPGISVAIWAGAGLLLSNLL